MSETVTLNNSTATDNLIAFAKREVSMDLKRDAVYGAYVKENGVTPETVKPHVDALREAAYPGVKPASRAERGSREYRAHVFASAVRNGLNRALKSDDDTPKPAVLRVTLSGEGGGTMVVERDHPLFLGLVALIKGEGTPTE
jgi:hypothetical protein